MMPNGVDTGPYKNAYLSTVSRSCYVERGDTWGWVAHMHRYENIVW